MLQQINKYLDRLGTVNAANDSITWLACLAATAGAFRTPMSIFDWFCFTLWGGLFILYAAARYRGWRVSKLSQ